MLHVSYRLLMSIFMESFITLHAASEINILMFGLFGAGKTTILRSIGQEIVKTTPRKGFTVETSEYENITFTVFDVACHDNFAQYWRPYLQNTKGLIFVVDSSDQNHMDDAVCVFQEMLQKDELSGAVLLVFANKQDKFHAIDPYEIVNILELFSIRARPWHIQGASGKSSEGVSGGLNWISSKLKNDKQ